jgi:hypothetical protein
MQHLLSEHLGRPLFQATTMHRLMPETVMKAVYSQNDENVDMHARVVRISQALALTSQLHDSAEMLSCSVFAAYSVLLIGKAET